MIPRPILVLVPLLFLPASAPCRDFIFQAVTPISVMANTIGMVGELNVVTSPQVRGAASFVAKDVTPLVALQQLASSRGLHVIKVPYTTARETYILSDIPIDQKDLVLVGPPPKDSAPKSEFVFRAPTPAPAVVRTIAQVGGFNAHWGGGSGPMVKLETRGLTAVEALHVFAHAVHSPVNYEHDAYILGAPPSGGAAAADDTPPAPEVGAEGY